MRINGRYSVIDLVDSGFCDAENGDIVLKGRRL